MRQFIDDDFHFLGQAAKSLPYVGGLRGTLLGWVFVDKLKPLPSHDEFRSTDALCHKRSLQDIGRYLIQRLASRGMIIEIDHLSYPTRLSTLNTLTLSRETLVHP